MIPQKLQSASLTAQAEDELKKIQLGEGEPKLYEMEVINLVKDLLKEASMVESMNENIVECPKCKGKLYRNESKFKKGEFYWRCAKCNANFDDDKGKVGAEKIQVKCPNCGKPIYRYESKFKKGEFSWYCSSCKTRYLDDNGKLGAKETKKESNLPEATCPECSGTAKRYQNKGNPEKYHWYCAKCKNNFADEDGKIGEKYSSQNA